MRANFRAICAIYSQSADKLQLQTFGVDYVKFDGTISGKTIDLSSNIIVSIPIDDDFNSTGSGKPLFSLDSTPKIKTTMSITPKISTVATNSVVFTSNGFLIGALIYGSIGPDALGSVDFSTLAFCHKQDASHTEVINVKTAGSIDATGHSDVIKAWLANKLDGAGFITAGTKANWLDSNGDTYSMGSLTYDSGSPYIVSSDIPGYSLDTLAELVEKIQVAMDSIGSRWVNR